MDKENQFIVKITGLSAEGDGIGSIEGLKVFIPHALPSEEVAIEIIEKKARYARGKLLQVLNKSHDRATPPCPFFSQCGGCQLMHLNYEKQLEAKRNRIVDAVGRIGHLKDIEILPCEPSPMPLAYRNKIQLPILFDKEKIKVGLFKRDSHDLVEIDQCLIQSTLGEKILGEARALFAGFKSLRYLLIRTGEHTGEALLILVTDGSESDSLRLKAKDFQSVRGVVENINREGRNTILGTQFNTLWGDPFYYEKVCDKTFRISAGSFFQVNSFQAPHLFKKALELADIQREDRVLDAYAGVGVLALLSAHFAKSVKGIEVARSSIEDAQENAKLNKIENASFQIGRAESIIQKESFDIVYLNPPRKGCDPKVIDALIKKRPRKIIYISCDPATLARDLALLNPHFTIERLYPFDMFPQTMHVETVALISS